MFEGSSSSSSRRFGFLLAAACLCAAASSSDEQAANRGLGGGKNSGPTIVINTPAGGYGQYGHAYGGFAAPYGVPPLQVVHNRVPSSRVASLETRSSPIAVAERPVLIAPASQPVCTTRACGPSVPTAPSVVVERQAVTQIVREKSCPPGMDLGQDGLMCVGLDICPVSYTCPPSSAPSADGRCVQTQRPLFECPPGAQLQQGGRCVQSEVLQAQLTCRDPRYSLDHHANVCVQAIEVPPRCPPGFSFGSGGECTQRCPAQAICPPGFSLSPASRECVRTVTEPAQAVCPEGSYQNPGSDACVVSRQDPPRCPPRFTFDAAQQICVQPVQRVLADCPYGHNRVGSSCERVEREPAEMTCPPGYDLGYDNVCVQSVDVPPTCPPGFVHSSNSPGRCEQCVKEQPVCPPGSRMAGYGRCEMEVERPSRECCASGFQLENGRCRRVEILAPDLTCEGECYDVAELPVAYACPADSEFVEDPAVPRCVRPVAVNKCEAPPAVRCLEELAEGGSRSLKSSCTPPPPPSCNTVQTMESLPAEPYCPQGGTLEGGRRCIARTPIVPERTCRVGTLDRATGQCTREIIAPVKTECPPGSSRRGNKCVAVESVAPQFSCPQSAVMGPDGMCVAYREVIQQPPRVSRVPAIPRCSSGSALSGRECLQSFRQPVESNCPPGSVDSGRGCYASADLIIPPPVEKTVRASLICPPESTLNGRVCVSTERIPADESCPAGTIQQMDGCYRVASPILSEPRIQTQPAVPVCADGCVSRGTSCVRTLETPPMISCPDGYYQEGEHCVRSVEKTALCPAGTMLQGSGCVRPVTVAPTVRIVNGCVNEVVRECESCPTQVKAECHNNQY